MEAIRYIVAGIGIGILVMGLWCLYAIVESKKGGSDELRVPSVLRPVPRNRHEPGAAGGADMPELWA